MEKRGAAVFYSEAVPEVSRRGGIREERVPEGRSEIIFYNLGKFSQLISDFETIRYHSKPSEFFLDQRAR